jgi:hypothetical protein
MQMISKTLLVSVCTVKAYRGVEIWFHSFLTSTVDGGEWSVSHWLLHPPGKEPLVHIEREAAWALEIFGPFVEKTKPIALISDF